MDDTRLPLTEHLAELRTRLIRIALAWVAGSALAWNAKEQIFRLLLAPAVNALGEGSRPLQAIAPTEIFFTYLECALLAGFLLALPVIFWQIWAFVAPGLYANEKNAIVPFVLISTLLFAGGALFGYTQIFPVMFGFFVAFDNEFVESAWTMSEVFSLTTRMFLALWRGTPYAVLAIFIVAAILTPTPDWVSQVLLAVPMVGLYLLGVAVAYLFGGARKPAEGTGSELVRK
jgi:sec-independent protein translocase protein TatC